MVSFRQVKHRRTPLLLEQLEDRLVPSGVDPTAVEQLMLEQLNDARSNPAAYGLSIGLDLSYVAAAQPLAFDTRLIAAARGHSLDMNNRGFFDHTNPDGAGPGERLRAQGYTSYTGWGESIAAGFNTTASALSGLVIDTGIPDLGHRRHLLAIDTYFQNHRQIGIGVILNGGGPYGDYYTLDTAAPGDYRPFLTGVAFNDLNGNSKYDVGEGLGGVTVTVQGVGSTTTFASGGYSLQLNPGTYVVTASGGGLSVAFTRVVAVSSLNYRLQISQNATAVAQAVNGAYVTHVWQDLLRRSASTQEINVFGTMLTNGTLTRDGLTAAVKASPEYGQVCTVWLRQAGLDTLGRQLSTAEVQNLLGWLRTTGSFETASAFFAGSYEGHLYQWSQLVRSGYQTYLHRTAASSEVSAWVGLFQTGLTNETFVTALVSGPEYAYRFGSTNSPFVAALCNDLLGRSGSTAEIAAWTNYLQAGGSRTIVVAIFQASFEHQWRRNQLLVAQAYNALLGRAPSSTDCSNCVSAMLNGLTLDNLKTILLSSYEYYQRAARGR